MKSKIFSRIINHFLMRYGAKSRIPNSKKTVFLTFDDGPECGITEFILDELDRYGFKATFFCTGKNAELHPELVEAIRMRGHLVGNHSYMHKHAYERSSSEYVSDILRADNILHTEFFRPPNGCLSLKAWMKLSGKFKMYYWAIASGDWKKESYVFDDCKTALIKTESGDIILFHFAKEFEMSTRQLIPWYLEWLYKNGYKSDIVR